MRKFKRHGAVISSELGADEVVLLQTLLSQLIELITPEQPAGSPAGESAAAGDDPFAFWAEQLADTDVAAPQDPALRRLFPDAYREDAEASADFRRFTQRDLRSKKIDDAEVALRHLALTDGGRQHLQIPAAEAEPWLRVLTSLRLSIAARLGIEDAEVAEALAELPPDDPRAYLASVYDWLGFAQETLVEAL